MLCNSVFAKMKLLSALEIFDSKAVQTPKMSLSFEDQNASRHTTQYICTSLQQAALFNQHSVVQHLLNKLPFLCSGVIGRKSK